MLQRKLRMTPQRQVILEEIKKSCSHPTTDALYEIVRRRLPRISLGTVYRNVEILSECGLIQRLELGGSQRRLDGNVHDHYHVRCVDCGRLEDLPTPPLETSDLAGQTEFDILGHRLEVIGRCPDCRANPGNSRAGKPRDL